MIIEKSYSERGPSYFYQQTIQNINKVLLLYLDPSNLSVIKRILVSQMAATFQTILQNFHQYKDKIVVTHSKKKYKGRLQTVLRKC